MRMTLKVVNVGLAFLLELCVLAALAYWGFQAASDLPLKIVLGIGAPLVVAVIWGRYMAPTAATRLTGSRYRLVKLIVFGVAAVALVLAGQGPRAIIFAGVSRINPLLFMAGNQAPA